jgi:hypothetical protein
LPDPSKTLVYRKAPPFLVAVPVWQLWQPGSSTQPTRDSPPIAVIEPWQLWHCIANVPSVLIV